MQNDHSVDEARLGIMLNELRLPTIKNLWPEFAWQADKEGWWAMFTRTTDLVQKLQVARRELQLEAAITKLDKLDLLILDHLAYITKDQTKTSVLFELMSARYERRSIMITANQPFGEWHKVLPDPAITLATVDRLVSPRNHLRDEFRKLQTARSNGGKAEKR